MIDAQGQPHELDVWSVEKLSARHERAHFDCGKPQLNEFLSRYAGQSQRLGISQTYVAVRPGSCRVEGYYTICSSSVAFASVPEPWRRKLPRYPVPVVLLARLAVDCGTQGKGLGRVLLFDALTQICKAAEAIGVFAVEVHALDAPARSFYAKYGFVPLLDNDLHLFLPLTAKHKAELI